MIPKINVQNRQRVVAVRLPALQRFASRALELCLQLRAPRTSALASAEEIEVVLISDERIAALHRNFLQLDGPTDVITFQHGEIFISAETAQRQAKDFRSSPLAEIELYLVHGLLHLHGFDDTTAESAAEMRRVQTRLVKKLRCED